MSRKRNVLAWYWPPQSLAHLHCRIGGGKHDMWQDCCSMLLAGRVMLPSEL